MEKYYLIVGVVSTVVFGILGYQSGKFKGRPFLGFILGATLSFLGLLIVQTMSPAHIPGKQRCGNCYQYIDEEIKICPHCKMAP